MSGNLPSDSDISVIVSDDVRMEANKKLSLLGFFVANRINVRDIGPTASIPLTFLIIIDGGDGEFEGALEVRSPSGKQMLKVDQKYKKLPNIAAINILKAVNFPVAETGEYSVNLNLDQKTFSKKFFVSHDPTIQAPF